MSVGLSEIVYCADIYLIVFIYLWCYVRLYVVPIGIIVMCRLDTLTPFAVKLSNKKKKNTV